MNIRTRFAPSPTGFLHIGGARTALFSWAYARRHGGKFILRIEDTDLERSTGASVNAILESMRWLGLDWDEGPFFQMKRLARYKEVAEQLIAAGHAYRCWMTREDLGVLRKEQAEKGLKPRYDGRWRPERAKAAGLVPPDRAPVIRFRTPEEGDVGWNDLVKGPISFPNRELDDLVLLRADGVPTYNFGVVADDLDMQITHVIRGDDHVNNTPRQLHIFKALLGEKELPGFAHLPMILGQDGERLSKRHGAVSVTQYRDEGFLPEALLNYLARLGWSHGDSEVFSMAQLVQWFDLAHVSRSAARFDVEKLRWLDGLYKQQGKSQIPPENRVEKAIREEPKLENLEKSGYPVSKAIDLFWSTGDTVSATSTAVLNFYADPGIPADLAKQYVPDESLPVLRDLYSRISNTSVWEKEAIREVVNSVLKDHRMKMPQLAMPLRVILWGTTKTKAIDESLDALGKEAVLKRLLKYLESR